MGKVGTLRIRVPWNQLSSQPVEIYVESVNVVLTPKGRNEWTDDANTVDTSFDVRKKFLDAFTQKLFQDLIVSDAFSSPTNFFTTYYRKLKK